MKKTALFIIVSLTMSSISYGQKPGKPCTVTCYEKTPTCYVTKDSSDCLVISDKKPGKTKNSYTCELKSCEVKTTYQGNKKEEVTMPSD